MDAPVRRLILAHEAPFQLGQLQVEPAVRLVRNGAATEIVEPRIMQLLVALHDARGRILSRDDLIDQCWDGRIVGENALQRAVSHARKLAASIGGGSFEIETVRGVGYRLRIEGAQQKEDSLATPSDIGPLLSRRAVIAAGGASALAGLGGFAFFVAPQDRPTSMALMLFSKGEAARREQDGGITGEQAVAYYSEAISESPEFADAWAGLALAYCDILDVAPVGELDRVAKLALSAARRSLELDPSNVNAKLAAVLVRPPFRRWGRAESDLARLATVNRRNWLISSHLGRLAAETGRPEAAIEHFRQTLQAEPLLPRVFGHLAYASWAAGELHDAGELLEKATERWPRSWWLWNARFQFLAFEGDTAAAARHVTDKSRIPWNLSPQGIPKRLQLIRVLEGDNRASRQESIQTHLAEARQHVLAVRNSALALAALDARDELFEVLRGYYLGAGPYATVITAHSRRPTYFLFLPPLRRLHSDGRFAELLQKIALA